MASFTPETLGASEALPLSAYGRGSPCTEVLSYKDAHRASDLGPPPGLREENRKEHSASRAPPAPRPTGSTAPAASGRVCPQASTSHDHEVPKGRGYVVSASRSLYIFKIKKEALVIV